MSKSTTLTREALEHAIQNDELLLYYQPKVCLLEGKILGAEALVRWSDGEQGLVSPDAFLPLAESSGLLHDLTLKLIEQVVSASNHLRAVSEGSPNPQVQSQELSLSINVAPNDLASQTISRRIRELLSDGTIRSHDLQIEITESAVMGNVERVYDDLCRLKDMGIKIMMDDFGTGYSSIDRLSQLPFDAIKLDQGVVQRIGKSQQNLDVVRSSISMARELGMTSVAEGVETADVYNFLIAQGCEEAQGYYIAKPMSLADFESFLSLDHSFGGSQFGRVHQAMLNLMQFRKMLSDAAFCSRMGKGFVLDSVANPSLDISLPDSHLGNWYFGAGQALSAHQEFLDIQQPLQDVHSEARAFLSEIKRGLTAEQLNESMAEIDQRIEFVMDKLRQLERILLISTPE